MPCTAVSVVLRAPRLDGSVLMTDEVMYLTPGFYVTLTERRKALHFAQLQGMLRRATPVRMAIIEALNNGYSGDEEALSSDLVGRFEAQAPAA